MASSRRSHPKSRTGCRTCKSRKIKCDEQRPSCRNCIKHGVDCDFTRQAGPSSGSPSSGILTSPNGGQGTELNLLDLELMHNFTTCTYSTLSYNTILRALWRDTVVQLALGCDYLMRTILAVSALHLAHLRPDKKDLYNSKAMQYHQLASRAAMDVMSHDINDNAQNLYLFSVLTIYFALASPRRPDGFLLVGESSFPEWMFLIRGTKSIIEIMGPATHTGPLSPMVRHGARRYVVHHHPLSKDVSNDHVLEDLRRLLRESVEDQAAFGAYDKAIERLQGAFRVCVFGDSLPVELTDAFVWMYQVADDFLPLLQVPTQEAVVIFSYFCVLLKRLDSHWWMNGWADHLISRAYQILDEEHKLWIRWPMEEIGWASQGA